MNKIKSLILVALVVLSVSLNAQTKSNQYLTVNYAGYAFNPFENRYSHLIEFTNNTTDQQLDLMIECDGNVSYYYVNQYQFAGTIDYNPNSKFAKKVIITILNVPNTPTLTLVINNFYQTF